MSGFLIETIVISFMLGGVIGGVIGLQLSHGAMQRRQNGR